MKLDVTKREIKKTKFYEWPVNSDLQKHMAMRKQQNLDKGMTRAERWFYEDLAPFTKFKWTHQARWGFRLFDFWCHYLGCAVEIDGPEHNKWIDKTKDMKEWTRSRIIVLRIKNFDKIDAQTFMNDVVNVQPWNTRRLAADMKPILNAG